MSMLIIWAVICVAAYLVGSIPFGYILGKIMHRKDIRTGGSGNIGATNALRQYGVKTGVLVLVFDLLKGFVVAWLVLNTLPIRFAQMIGPEPVSSFVATLPLLLVILGHMFPVWLGFKGGKGVATTAGVFLAYAPLPLLISLVIFFALTALTRYVSLGSIAAALSLFLIHLLWALFGKDSAQFPWFTLVVAVLIIYKHQANILRLLEKKEHKLSFKKTGNA